jgi:hypothetical protein
MADTLQGAITNLSESVTQTNTSTVVANQTGSTVITASELNTETPSATSTQITVNPSTGNRIPVLYGTAYVPGIIVDARISNDSQTMYYIYALSEITGSGSVSVDEVWMGEQQLNFSGSHEVVSAVNADGTTDTNPAGYIDVWVYRERTTPIFGANTGTADSIVPGFTTDNKFGGLYFAIVRVKYAADRGYTTMPQMTFKMTNTLSNPGLVWYDFLVNSRYGAGIPSARVDQESSINDSNPASLAAVSAELTTYRDTEGVDVNGPRYTINGLLVGGTIKDNIRKINLASGSWTTWNPKVGKWIVVPNRPVADGYEPFAFSDSNIISGITVSTTSLDSNYNEMAITYPETAIKAQNHTVRVSLFDDNPELLNVNEPENSLNLTLDLVDNKVQATRIGLLELKQAREDIVALFRANYSALQVDAGDVVSVTNAALGWTNKLFRVTRVREIETEDAEIQVEISALEYNADVYTDESIDQFEPVANTDIPRRASSGQLQALDVLTIPDDLYNPVATIPSFAVRATIPSNRIYDTLEFFISSTTAGGIYNYYATLKPTAGVFQPDSEHDLLVTGLPEGEYFFKVRAKVGSLTTPLSPASSGVDWTPGVILNESALTAAFEWSPPTIVVPTDSEGNNPTTGQTAELVLRVGTTKLNLSAATTDETQANNTWRVTNITYNDTNLDLSSPSYDTVNDKVVWTINDLNALQESLIVTVRYKNSDGEFTDLGTTRVLATQLRAGADGSNSRSLRLITSSNYFTRLKGETDGNTTAYLPAVINLTAQLNNIPTGTVTWSAHDASNNPITLNTSGATATLSNSNFGNRDYVVVHAEIDSGGVTYFDEQTIVRLREGADGVTGITSFLSNEVAALPAAVDGTYESADLAAISSQMFIYAGSANVSEDYTLTVDSETGCDANINTTSGSNYGRITLASVSADLASVTVKAAKSGAASIYKTFVIVKQRRGATGANGNDGATARLLRVSSTSPIITVAKNGSVANTATHQPASVSYYAEAINLPGVTITWTGLREGASTPVSLGTGTVLTLSATQIRDLLTTSESVRSATITATTTYASVTFTDSTSIQRVREGSDTIAGYLTNESASVPCDESGIVVGSLSGITSTLKIIQGATDVSASATDFTVVSSSGVTGAAITNLGVVSFTGITADAASITVSAIFGGQTVVKVFSITKQRQGITGSARAIKLSATNQYFVLAQGADPNSGSGLTPASITLTAARVNIPTGQAVSFFAVIDGVEHLQTGTPNPASNQFLFFSSGSLTPSISKTNYGGRDTLVVRAKCSYLGVTYTDDYTIGRLQSGSDAFTLSLDNEVVTVGAATNSTIIAGQFPIAVNVSMFVGATDDTANWSFSANAKSGSPSFSISGNVLTVTSVPSLSSSALVRRDVITITASKAGFPSVDRDFAIQVVRAGRDAAAQMVLTNEVHNFPASYDGVISSYSGAISTIYVYEGGLPVTDWTMSITSSTPEVTFTVASTGLPTGAIRRVTVTNWSGTGNQATITIQASKAGFTSLSRTFALNRINAGAPGANSNILKVTASSQVVKTNASGVVQTPTSITLTGIKSGALTGTPTWTVTSGTATLSSGSGNSITIATNTIATDSITVRGSITIGLTTYYDDVTIVKVADGATGSAGSPGNRGSRIFNQTIVGTSFNDTTAYTAASVSGGPIPGDTVTQTNNTTFTGTKIWIGPIAGANSPSNWSTVNNVIDGNLLVTGSVRASKIYTDDTFTMSVQSNNYIAGTQGWKVDKTGSAEFSNITARGAIEASVIRTGSTLVDRIGTTDHKIYTTAHRNYRGNISTLTNRPIPYRPAINNYGAPVSDFSLQRLEWAGGPWMYDTGATEAFLSAEAQTNELAIRANDMGLYPVFATTNYDLDAGQVDKANYRLRKFTSVSDEIAFGGTVTLTTNAPALEICYMATAKQNGMPYYTTSRPVYTGIRKAGLVYNPAFNRRIALDSGNAQHYGAGFNSIGGFPPPYRVLAMTAQTGNRTRIRYDMTNYADSVSQFQVGDTIWMYGGEYANTNNQWAGALNTSGAAWTPGTTTNNVGNITDFRIGVRVTAVYDFDEIEIDCSFANASTYASGVLLFTSVGQSWLQNSDASYTLYNFNRPWTFGFSSRVVWSDFFDGTAPSFPANGITNWELKVAIRAPFSHAWYVIEPSMDVWAQNF